MSTFEKLAQHIRAYLTPETTTEEVGKVYEMLMALEGRHPAPAPAYTPAPEPESTGNTGTIKRRRASPGSGRRGPFGQAVEFFGTGGTLDEIGDKALEYGMRLPSNRDERRKAVQRRLKQSQNVYRQTRMVLGGR